MVMNEAERRRFLSTLRQDDDFRSDVRREILTEELLELPHTVATLVDVVAQQRQDFAALAADVRTYMERTIASLRDGFAAASETFTEVRNDITEVRNDNTELRNDTAAGFAAVNARLDQLHADVQSIRKRPAS